MINFLRDNVAHIIAIVSIVSLLGAARLTRAMTAVYGHQIVGQVLLLLWGGGIVAMIYQAPLSLGVWSLGFVVPLFGDKHFQAWGAEQRGAAATVRSGEELLAKAGRLRYFAAVSIRPALQVGLASVIIALSPYGDSWEWWLGLGLFLGAVLNLIESGMSIARAGRVAGPPRSLGAA